MKAAILHQLGALPSYQDFAEPVPQNDEQILITVKAASLKNLDKARASGRHYASYTALPAIVGIDGIGLLPNGTRVYAQGVSGMMAEKALIAKNRYTILPDNIDDATAAALPNAVIGAAMALRYRADIKPGDVVLINGATGVTGQVAVQTAKHYGASRVIATGRNTESLERLKSLGADEIISLKGDDETILKALKNAHAATPVNLVIDYLWGHPVALIITALKGEGGLGAVPHKVRIVTVGSMAGEEINLASGVLRSSPIEIMGSGFGSLSAKDLQQFSATVLPEMFALASEGKLSIQTETIPLTHIESAWNREVAAGKRLVIII